ncbi:MAG: PaaI family thioesterase [Gaiellales bacterium]
MDDPLAAHPLSPLDRAIGLSYVDTDGDEVVLRLDPTETALGYEDPPMLHGGTLATLVDTAGWYAVMHAAPATWVAVDLRSDFLRMADLSALRVTARCLRAGRTLAVCDVRVAPWDAPERTTSVGRIQFIRTGD